MCLRRGCRWCRPRSRRWGAEILHEDKVSHRFQLPTQVFEARLPLAWDVQLALGCCALPVPHASARPLGETFSLTDLAVSLLRKNAELWDLGARCRRHTPPPAPGETFSLTDLAANTLWKMHC